MTRVQTLYGVHVRHSVASKEEIEAAIKGDKEESSANSSFRRHELKRERNSSYKKSNSQSSTRAATTETKAETTNGGKYGKEGRRKGKRRGAEKASSTSQTVAEAKSEIPNHVALVKKRAGKVVEGFAEKKKPEQKSDQQQKQVEAITTEQKHDNPSSLNLDAVNSPIR